MMKKALLMTVAGVALGLMAAQAQAADYAPAAETGGWYVSIFGGVSFPASDAEGSYFGSEIYSLDQDTGFIVGAAIGSTLWSENVRGEIEVSYLNQDVNEFNDETEDGDSSDASGDIGQWFLLANLWYDWHTGSGFTPYVGGGVGVGWADPDFDATEEGDDEPFSKWDSGSIGFAGQLGAGVKWEIADGFALDLGYRFKALIDADLQVDGGFTDCCNLVSTDFLTHNIQLGLTVGF